MVFPWGTEPHYRHNCALPGRRLGPVFPQEGDTQVLALPALVSHSGAHKEQKPRVADGGEQGGQQAERHRSQVRAAIGSSVGRQDARSRPRGHREAN